MRKNSCSRPMFGTTESTEYPRFFIRRVVSVETDFIERRRGVFSSRASP
jgi:hypothetical protein